MVAKLPGKSYDEMKALIIRNHGLPYAFSYELLIAIFWEESFFNNLKQDGGTAWGFGQVEPSGVLQVRDSAGQAIRILCGGFTEASDDRGQNCAAGHAH